MLPRACAVFSHNTFVMCCHQPCHTSSHRGFWRLLVVREGRDPSFLPLPAVAPTQQQQQQHKQQQAADAAADGSDKQQRRHQRLGQLPDPAVLAPCAMADLPADKWFVSNPLATAAAGEGEGEMQGIPVTEVRRLAWVNV